jgi:ketosteroid isomerase-like protein
MKLTHAPGAALSFLIILAAALLSGCASPQRSNSASEVSKDTTQVRQRLRDIFDAAAKKDMPRLDSYHLYGSSFSKFGGGQLGRLDAEAARQGEHEGLGAANGLSMQADDLKIDLFNDVAIATFILNYSFQSGPDRIQKNERATLVFVKDHGAWKIVHEHLSPFKAQP